MNKIEPRIADRIAEVPVLGEPELLALRKSTVGDESEAAQGLIAAIDGRLEEIAQATGMSTHGEALARAMLRIIERRSAAGGWVWAENAFQVALTECRANPYVAYVAEDPARRTHFADILETLRAAEFPHLEQRTDGTWQGARTYFRARRRT